MGKATELATAEKEHHFEALEDQHELQEDRRDFPPSKRGGSVKIDLRTRRLIIRKVSSGAGGAKKVRDALQLPVSLRTVQRCLENTPWLKFKKLRCGPMLKPGHVRARIDWASGTWMGLMATSSGSTREQSNRCQIVAILVWFSHDLGRLLPRPKDDAGLYGRFTSVKYMATLQNQLQPAFDIGTQIFQHDNAAPHAARHTKTWLLDQGFDVMTWPACSPDLNPIESVWGYMSRHVYANERQLHLIQELKNAIQQVWDQIPASYLLALVTSMPKRVQILKEANGKHIPY
uniref:GJ22539 putative n=1 Tax=Albugo laibachii Nc14 TaxID=890382 RepID=F0WQ65_9STRA|nr:GJ22539 putative [Albugo laibachii Nc14]|eukprot:CCA23471.1 GJ22539 putative [Albugo laibachii Nc14]